MDYLPTWQLGLRIIVHVTLGAYPVYLILAFSTLADPLEKLYNESIYNHYGLILGKQEFAYIVGMISAAKLVGSIVSLMVLYPMLDTVGRKKMAVHVPFVLGGILGAGCQILAKVLTSVELFFIGEIFIGAALPLMNFATIMYLSESAPNRIRGATTLLLSIVGITSWIGMSILAKPHVLGSSEKWHWIPILASIAATIHFCICVCYPESPKYLYYQNKKEESARAVRIFHGKDEDIDEVLDEYSLEVHHPLDDQVTLWKIWQDTEYREALVIVLLFDLANQLAPNSIDVNYHVVIRKKLGYNVDEIMLQRILISGIIFPLNFLAAYAVERFGRRFITVYCFIVGMFQVALMAFGEFLYDTDEIGLVSRVTGTLTSIAGNLLSNSGFVNMTFLMMAELCVPSMRTTVAQAAALLAMIAQMFVFSTYPPLVAALGYWYYLLTTIVITIIFFFIFRKLPETKSMPVNEIIDNLEEIVRSRANTLVITRSRANSERDPLLSRRRSTMPTHNFERIPSRKAPSVR